MIDTLPVLAVATAVLFGVGRVGRPPKGPHYVPGQRAVLFGPKGDFLPSRQAPDAAAATAATNVRGC